MKFNISECKMLNRIFAVFLVIFWFSQKHVVVGQGGNNSKQPGNKTAVFKASFIESSKYCAERQDITMVQVLALFTEKEIEDKNGKCYIHCMMQRYRLMDKDGNYINEKFKPFLEYIPISNFLKSIKKNLQTCLKEDDTDPCEKAYKFIKCFHKREAKGNPFQGSETIQPAEGFERK